MKPNQLSKTAAFIVIKFYGLTRLPSFRSLFNPSVIAFYENIVYSLPAPLNHYRYWLKYDWVRRFYIWSEELFLPGDLLHIVARKYFIRKWIETLANQGYEQIIILGSGFDDLGFTFSQQGYSCIEVDVSRMSKHKKQFFNRYYPDSRHPEIISAHLSDDQSILSVLEQANIAPSQKTVIVAEGFFDYMETDFVASTLGHIQHYFNTSPTLITTHFALDELPFFHRWSFKTGVKTVGEELKLHKSIDEFYALLANNKFELHKELDCETITKQLQQKTGTRLPTLQGFYLIMAK